MTTTVDANGQIVDDGSSNTSGTLYENNGIATDANGNFYNPNIGNIYYENSGATSTDSGAGGIMPGTTGPLDPGGKFDPLKWAADNKGWLAAGGAALGLMGSNNPKFGKTGYQGGIPDLTATRSMISAPPKTGYRPGQGGIDYGGDVTYTRTPGLDPWHQLSGTSASNTGLPGLVNPDGTPVDTSKVDNTKTADDAAFRALIDQAYGSIGRKGFGKGVNEIDQGGYDFWLNALKNGTLNKDTFMDSFNKSVNQYMTQLPTDPLTKYINNLQNESMVKDAYAKIGRSGVGADVKQIDKAGMDYWVNALNTGAITKAQFNDKFMNAINSYVQSNPDAELSKYVSPYIKPNRAEDIAQYTNIVASGTPKEKSEAYNRLLGQGLTDAQILSSVENAGGKQNATDWAELKRLGTASTEPLTTTPASKTVEDLYASIGRKPDAEGLKFWKEHFGDSVDPSEAASFMKSATEVIAKEKEDSVKKAGGGLLGAAKGRYLQGETDGMADELPAQIGKNQPASLSHGEFVVPADVVSHLGNGNSDAGAKKLYQMMDKIRMARTGNKKQGKKINPDKFMPGGLAQAYAQGGEVKRFVEGGPTSTPAGNVNAGIAGVESNLSNWAGPYVTNMLGQGQALANMPYQAYMGQLTAGPSALQNKVSTGLQSLSFPNQLGQTFSSTGAPSTPTMGADAYANQPVGTGAGASQLTSGGNQPSGGIASQYMNPYLQSVLDPQLEELRRQSKINLQPGLAKLTQAGGFGGSRQAIMESEANRNLLQEQNKTIGQGYANAYDKAMGQFNTEQGQGVTLANLMSGQGATERGIESEGIAADKAQFEEARANPYKMVQFQQSLLQGLPTSAQSYNMTQPSALTSAAQGATTVNQLLKNLGINLGQ